MTFPLQSFDRAFLCSTVGPKGDSSVQRRNDVVQIARLRRSIEWRCENAFVNASQRPIRTGSTKEDTARFEATRLAESVNALPAAITASETSELLRSAAIDCFFGQVRTLIEFLGVKQARAPKGAPADWTAAATLGLSQWSPPKLSPTDRDTLLRYWEASSKHLAHFSYLRPVQLPIYREDLDEIADKVLAAWDEYADASQNNPLVPHRADFWIEPSTPRVATSRTAVLMDAIKGMFRR